MPFKSKAQRRKFAELLVKGEISPETFEQWNRETGGATLPERAPRKQPKKQQATAKKKRSSTPRKRASKRAGKRKARSSVRNSGHKRKR